MSSYKDSKNVPFNKILVNFKRNNLSVFTNSNTSKSIFWNQIPVHILEKTKVLLTRCYSCLPTLWLEESIYRSNSLSGINLLTFIICKWIPVRFTIYFLLETFLHSIKSYCISGLRFSGSLNFQFNYRVIYL